MMQKSSSWITSIEPPINGGTLRYKWMASPEHDGACCFREDDNGFLLQEKASEALVIAVQAAIRGAILAAAH
jgi:hypothetical protein